MNFKAKMQQLVCQVFTLILLMDVTIVSSDVFTSMNRIKDMVLNEQSILHKVQNALQDSSALKNTFLSFYQQRINEIRGRNLTQEAQRLNHPNGAYTVIKEFAKDYENLRRILLDSGSDNVRASLAEIADENDVLGARLSLLRLQEVYHLKPRDMVKGNYLRFRGPKLNYTDAYLVGQTAFTHGKYSQSAEWLETALTLKNEELGDENKENIDDDELIGQFGKTGKTKTKTKRSVDAPEALALLGRVLMRLGKDKRALNLYEAAQKLDPHHGDVLMLSEELHNAPAPYEEQIPSDVQHFYTLCAKQSQTVPKFPDHRLRCRYRGVFVPYYRYKEEILSNTPFVSLYYEIISDREADHVKSVSIEKLYRGVVVGPSGSETSKIRTSHVAFIEDNESQVVNSISKRIAQLTGLETAHPPEGFFSKKQSGSEPLQVVNYGLGGHYSVHMDPYEHLNQDTEKVLLYSGNRLATFLIYLTDVERGGSTAFPRADLVVSPVKTNAVFWYSFTPAGDLDTRTLHAGCPVVVGEKWIINKWILSFGNTFNRRCGLSRLSTQLDIDEDMINGWQ